MGEENDERMKFCCFVFIKRNYAIVFCFASRLPAKIGSVDVKVILRARGFFFLYLKTKETRNL